ncbi:biotin-dependent carboxyltransferase family protein [Undibacterium sp. Di24W]|uniref:5-oxoprolinase subunit C family protein n=1 Tax=Undibacterium sp. Di24W TaxID=3413033 RepID=UPI003BF232E8
MTISSPSKANPSAANGKDNQLSQLRVLKAGIQTSVQDLGRHGQRHLGISQSGALDRYSLMLANKLVGNAVQCAGIEIVIGPVEIQFQRDSWFAIGGANFAALLDGKSVAKAWRHFAKAGQILRLTGAVKEARAYLAVDGGIAVPQVLGSRSTDLQAGFGGYHGRALMSGDVLELGPAQDLQKSLGVQQRIWSPEIRAIPGPEYEQFSSAARQQFWQQAWKLSPQSNRMGCRLQGLALQRTVSQDLLSHGVLPGVVQVPPNGLPIILLADAQTTGGYPKIACVIEADLWKVAQTPPGHSFCFIPVENDTAILAQEKWRREFARIDWIIHA